MTEPPRAFIKHLIPVVPEIRLEPIEQTRRHPARFAGDCFDLAVDRLLRVNAVQQKPQNEPKVLGRLRNFSSSTHAIRRGTSAERCQEKTVGVLRLR